LSKNFKLFNSSFNPLARSIGVHTSKDFKPTSKTTENHEFTIKLKESGYTNNISTFDKTGWVPHHNLHSDMVRSEYRININPYKPLHFKGPIYSTGAFKKRETVYKHM